MTLLGDRLRPLRYGAPLLPAQFCPTGRPWLRRRPLLGSLTRRRRRGFICTQSADARAGIHIYAGGTSGWFGCNGRRICRFGRLARLRRIRRDAGWIAGLLRTGANSWPPACTSEQHHRQDGDQGKNATQDRTSSIERQRLDIRSFNVVAAPTKEVPLPSGGPPSPPDSPRPPIFQITRCSSHTPQPEMVGHRIRPPAYPSAGCDPFDIPGSASPRSSLLCEVRSGARIVLDRGCGLSWFGRAEIFRAAAQTAGAQV